MVKFSIWKVQTVSFHWNAKLDYSLAEAHGIRATGIGCFYDDPFRKPTDHRLKTRYLTHLLFVFKDAVCGIRDFSFQSLYHFTVGGPEDDERIQTLEVYETKDSNPYTVE